ncbi:Topoisomerase IV subunit A, partial [hydrothermal vent metagenome]
KYYVKRFAVKGVTRDKVYDLTRGTKDSKVIYFSANPNGEAEVIRVNLRPKPKMKRTHFDFDFKELAIKGRSSQGNILSKVSVRNVVKREEGVSTLGALDIWYDDTVRRLNTEERGRYLGAFKGGDRILSILSTGEFKLTGFDIATHFDDEMVLVEKFDPRKIISAVYLDAAQDRYYVKRFGIDADTPSDKKYLFISDAKGSKLVVYSMDYLPQLKLEMKAKENGEKDFEVVPLADFIGVKSYRAKGKRLTNKAPKKIKLLSPLPYEPPIEEEAAVLENEPEDVNSERNIPVKQVDETDTSKDEEEKLLKEEKKPDNKPEDDEIQLELF